LRSNDETSEQALGQSSHLGSLRQAATT
jgi:hypothetical protein